MKKISKVVLVGIGVFFLFSFCFTGIANQCFAQSNQSTKEEVPPRSTDLSADNPIRSFFKNGKVDCLLSLSEGFDDNVFLNPDRKGDTFTQAIFKSTFTSPLDKKTNGILEYELMSLLYAEQTNADLIRNNLGAGLDYKINKNLNFLTRYHFGSANYISSGKNDFLDHRLEFVLKQKLPSKFYHKLGYEIMYKWYQESKTRETATAITSNNRVDLRNTIEYEIGKYFPKDLFKIGLQYYHNNSNEGYLDYYDYDSYKTTYSLTHLFSKKLFTYLSYARQFRYYDSRTIVSNANFRERDRTYVATSAFYYNFTKTFTLGLSYIYRQNQSSEPTEKYAGSIVSLGGYYKF